MRQEHAEEPVDARRQEIVHIQCQLAYPRIDSLTVGLLLLLFQLKATTVLYRGTYGNSGLIFLVPSKSSRQIVRRLADGLSSSRRWIHPRRVDGNVAERRPSKRRFDSDTKTRTMPGLLDLTLTGSDLAVWVAKLEAGC